MGSGRQYIRDGRDAAVAESILILLTIVDIALSLIAVSLALFALININLLAYNIFQIALWFLWIICALRYSSLALLWPTWALTSIMLILDAVLSIKHLIIGFNCVIAGTDCPLPPDTGYTIALLGIIELGFFLILLLQFISLLYLIYGTYQDERNRRPTQVLYYNR